MKRNVLAYLLLLVLLLTACGRWQKADMLRQLNELQAMNQADSLLTNDSLAKALASYFDDYGTPNERMLAHYLLARTYTDMGDINWGRFSNANQSSWSARAASLVYQDRLPLFSCFFDPQDVTVGK